LAGSQFTQHSVVSPLKAIHSFVPLVLSIPFLFTLFWSFLSTKGLFLLISRSFAPSSSLHSCRPILLTSVRHRYLFTGISFYFFAICEPWVIPLFLLIRACNLLAGMRHFFFVCRSTPSLINRCFFFCFLVTSPRRRLVLTSGCGFSPQELAVNFVPLLVSSEYAVANFYIRGPPLNFEGPELVG